MPSFTKKAIVESFLRIIGKKPLDKITVRDVVDDCGINRNTFYYYFQDIYAVLEEISHNVADSLPKGQSLAVTFEIFFREMGIFTAARPRTTKGLLMSLGLDGLERYFAKDLDAVIVACLCRKEAERTWEDVYLRYVTAFFRHAIFGFCLDFLRLDRADAFEGMLANVKQLLQDAECTFCAQN